MYFKSQIDTRIIWYPRLWGLRFSYSHHSSFITDREIGNIAGVCPAKKKTWKTRKNETRIRIFGNFGHLCTTFVTRVCLFVSSFICFVLSFFCLYVCLFIRSLLSFFPFPSSFPSHEGVLYSKVIMGGNKYISVIFSSSRDPLLYVH